MVNVSSSFWRITSCPSWLFTGVPISFKMGLLAKQYLADKPFLVIFWPGNSPDLNFINKNAWNYMKNKLNDQDISLVPKLKEGITKKWTMDISVKYLRTLSDFMPRRMEKIIKNVGDMMKY
jgi:hypothetical protein